MFGFAPLEAVARRTWGIGIHVNWSSSSLAPVRGMKADEHHGRIGCLRRFEHPFHVEVGSGSAAGHHHDQRDRSEVLPKRFDAPPKAAGTSRSRRAAETHDPPKLRDNELDDRPLVRERPRTTTAPQHRAFRLPSHAKGTAPDARARVAAIEQRERSPPRAVGPGFHASTVPAPTRRVREQGGIS